MQLIRHTILFYGWKWFYYLSRVVISVANRTGLWNSDATNQGLIQVSPAYKKQHWIILNMFLTQRHDKHRIFLKNQLFVNQPLPKNVLPPICPLLKTDTAKLEPRVPKSFDFEDIRIKPQLTKRLPRDLRYIASKAFRTDLLDNDNWLPTKQEEARDTLNQ